MQRRRLTAAEFADYLGRHPADVGDLVVELRDFVLRAAPSVDEAVKFHALCYFKPRQPFGAIGGNVCMISPKPECVRLEFIHGASLRDPDRILHGSAKAKRYIEIRCGADIPRGPVRALIRASVAHAPAGE